MKRIIISLVIILALASCSDDDTPTAVSPYHEQKGSVLGKLVDAITQEPVVGAYISTDPLSSSAISKNDGTFVLKEVGPGEYNLLITHSDYVDFSKKMNVSVDVTNDLILLLVSKKSVNTPPEKPTLIYPTDNSVVGTQKIIFRWNAATDANKDTIKYDVYFGEANQEMKVIGKDILETTFEYEYNLVEGKTYQWKVVAKDKYSETSSVSVLFGYKKKVIVDLPGLLGIWKLDGNADDSGVFAYNGEGVGIQYVNDRSDNKGQAAYFNGSHNFSSRIVVSDKNIQLKNEFTIAFWIKPDAGLGDNGPGYFDIVSKWGGGAKNAASWDVGIYKGGNIFISTYQQSNTTRLSNFTVVSNIWHHIAVTFDNGKASFYLDGVFQSESGGLEIPQYSNLPLGIGARYNQDASYHGALDDVYIFQRVLKEAEIKNLME